MGKRFIEVKVNNGGGHTARKFAVNDASE